MIKAIETKYNGLLFRSKLEARHAKTFDKYGIVWEYEPYALTYSRGEYWPDFILPEVKMIVEVKGKTVPGKEKAIEAFWQNHITDAIDPDYRMVISDGEHPEIYVVRKIGNDKGVLQVAERHNETHAMYCDGSSLTTCRQCKRVQFNENLFVYVCNACGEAHEGGEDVPGQICGVGSGEGDIHLEDVQAGNWR